MLVNSDTEKMELRNVTTTEDDDDDDDDNVDEPLDPEIEKTVAAVREPLVWLLVLVVYPLLLLLAGALSLMNIVTLAYFLLGVLYPFASHRCVANDDGCPPCVPAVSHIVRGRDNCSVRFVRVHVVVVWIVSAAHNLALVVFALFVLIGPGQSGLPSLEIGMDTAHARTRAMG